MKVIFKKDLARVARKHQIKDVPSGYAANFLFPNGYAVMATPKAEKELSAILSALESDKKNENTQLQNNFSRISQITLKILSKANEKGHLFSGIHKEQIAEELQKQAHLHIPAEFISIEKPIKETGEHKIKIESGDHHAILTLEISGQ